MATKNTNEYRNISKQKLLAKEREVLGFNLTSIMDDYKIKININEFKPIKFIVDSVINNENFKDEPIAGIVTSIDYFVSKAGNQGYWISISDDWHTYKMYCSLKIFNEYAINIIKDECSLFKVSCRNGFVSFSIAKKMCDIPIKKGYGFFIHLPFNIHSNSIVEYIEDELGVSIDHGSCQVFLKTRGCDDLFIDPTYSLIKTIQSKFGVKCSVEFIDEYLYGESLKLIEYYDSIIDKSI